MDSPSPPPLVKPSRFKESFNVPTLDFLKVWFKATRQTFFPQDTENFVEYDYVKTYEELALYIKSLDPDEEHIHVECVEDLTRGTKEYQVWRISAWRESEPKRRKLQEEQNRGQRLRIYRDQKMKELLVAICDQMEFDFHKKESLADAIEMAKVILMKKRVGMAKQLGVDISGISDEVTKMLVILNDPIDYWSEILKQIEKEKQSAKQQIHK